MSAAWPVVADRLNALLPTLAGWSAVAVFDGPPVTADVPAAYLTVGFVVGEDFGGTYEQTRGVAGMLEEVGSVRCELVCATGDVDLLAMRTQAFDLVDAWEASIAADQTLGVLGASSTSSLAVDVQPAQTQGGARQRLTVTLNYFSRQ